jgi:hypothetical protein
VCCESACDDLSNAYDIDIESLREPCTIERSDIDVPAVSLDEKHQNIMQSIIHIEMLPQSLAQTWA